MRAAEKVGALALLVVLGIHIGAKIEGGLLWEMLWSCNVTALLVAIGVLVDRREVVSVGWLTFVAVGFPLWILDQAVGATTTWPSAAAHMLTPAVGFVYVRRAGLWRHSVTTAFVLHVLLVVLSMTFTPAALNVNMTHEVWPPLADWFPNIWVYQLANTAGVALALAGAFLLARRLRVPGGSA